jgi:hypothetical protein
VRSLLRRRSPPDLQPRKDSPIASLKVPDDALGTAVLVAGTVTVSHPRVTARSLIFLTAQSPGGTPDALRVSARTPGTSFTITSANAADTSTVGYLIIEPH